MKAANEEEGGEVNYKDLPSHPSLTPPEDDNDGEDDEYFGDFILFLNATISQSMNK